VARLTVFQDLIVTAVTTAGRRVSVDVATVDGRAHAVEFTFDDPHAAFRQGRVVEAWRQAGTLVTYVRGRGRGALIDDAAAFRSAMGAAPA
jgi:hypothetical protein